MSQHYNINPTPTPCLAFPTVLIIRRGPRAVKGSHTEDSKHFTVITVCNRWLTGLEAFLCRGMQRFVMLLCRVQSEICQGFDCFFDYRWLELNDLSAHGFERAPPTHKVAVRPIIIFALTFKARCSAHQGSFVSNIIETCY